MGTKKTTKKLSEFDKSALATVRQLKKELKRYDLLIARTGSAVQADANPFEVFSLDEIEHIGRTLKRVAVDHRLSQDREVIVAAEPGVDGASFLRFRLLLI